MSASGPYHAGERAVQEASGQRTAAERNGRVIGGHLVPGAMRFIPRLPMLVVASIDADGLPWASLLFGHPGFCRALDPQTLAIECEAGRRSADPLWANLLGDPRIGLLFIDLGSRARYRVNGRVLDPQADALRIRVEEAYPNCPQYVQRRHVSRRDPPARPAAPARGRVLGSAQRRLLSEADTIFVASANPAGGLDVSHRGGRPGFLCVTDAAALVVPDYPGNGMFNTLGNLTLHPWAGVVALDFAAGRLLQVGGPTTLDFGASEIETSGTKRAWRLSVETWREEALPGELAWDLLDRSPANP